MALLKVPANDQAHKIGSLFVNPGGPGGSAVDMAAAAPYLFNTAITSRFDVIGIDPRGVAYSDQLHCFPDARRQQPVLTKLNLPFPVTRKEVRSYSRGAEQLGRACSDYGKKLAGAMSTAEDARDMDVIRRAVGDRQLTYLGFSYGTYLGQVYANLFPDRVRSMVIDGVLDPIAWAGTPDTADIPQTLRVPSGQGAYRALKEALRRCDVVGVTTCAFASTTAGQTSLQKFDALAASMRTNPIVISDPDEGDYTVDYATMIAVTLSDLYDPSGAEYVMDDLQFLWENSALAGQRAAARPPPGPTAPRRGIGSSRPPGRTATRTASPTTTASRRSPACCAPMG